MPQPLRLAPGLLGCFVLVFAVLPVAALPLEVRGGTLETAGQEYTADGEGAVAVRASEGAQVRLTQARIRAAGPSQGFWAEGGSSLGLASASVRAGSLGGRATGLGTKVVLQQVDLRTVGTGSAGLRVEPGTSLSAVDLVATTEGLDAPTLETAGEVQISRSLLVSARSVGATLLGGHGLSLTDTTVVAGFGPALLFEDDGDPLATPGTIAVSGGSLTATHGPLVRVARAGSALSLQQVLLVPEKGSLVLVEAGASLSLVAGLQTLEGAFELERGSLLTLRLKEGARWSGTSDPSPDAGTLNVSLDAGSLWTLTADATVGVLSVSGLSLTEGLKGLRSQGHVLRYRTSANPWFGGRTWPLEGGGSLVPY